MKRTLRTMKLYVWHPAPNPRRVLVFLAEKGLEISTEDVGAENATLSRDYVARYPQATVPMLELDDGTQIGEAMAICRYLEEIHPDPPLLGKDAKEKALVEMWEQRAYEEGLLAAAEAFRNLHPAFRDRGLPGFGEPIPQIPELVERGRKRFAAFARKMDAHLASSEFLAGERYTVADVTALCAVDFLKMAKADLPEGCPNLVRWRQTVSARPSARAGI